MPSDEAIAAERAARYDALTEADRAAFEAKIREDNPDFGRMSPIMLRSHCIDAMVRRDLADEVAWLDVDDDAMFLASAERIFEARCPDLLLPRHTSRLQRLLSELASGPRTGGRTR